MKVAVLGFNGPVAQQTRGELTRRGHQCCAAGADAVRYLPGSLPELRQLVSQGGFRRLVVRSHASVYGAHLVIRKAGTWLPVVLKSLSKSVPDRHDYCDCQQSMGEHRFIFSRVVRYEPQPPHSSLEVKN